MPLACPNCNSRFLRHSKPRTLKEKLDRLRFISPLRCLDCKTRFVARTLILSDLTYARCPICRRMDLATWTGRTFEPPFWMGLKIAAGAQKWRCEYCRINFADFRKRYEVFSFKRWEKLGKLKQQTAEADRSDGEMRKIRSRGA